MDYLGPLEGHMVLILVDAYTGWIDAHSTKSTSASETMRMVRKSFANFGVAKTVVSDNGPQFLSNEFNGWSYDKK